VNEIAAKLRSHAAQANGENQAAVARGTGELAAWLSVPFHCSANVMSMPVLV
jgi:hypothetical protein